MTLSTQPYKGTRDFYPPDHALRSWLFDRMRAVAHRYGFQEYDGPMLEPFELYAAKTGEEIVNQQLYWLMDRGERKLAVRPEMTPTLARMVAARASELPRPIRWFSIPNLWRYERPQRGRLREHWQLNVDVLGGDPLLADAEVLGFAQALMQELGGAAHTSIRVNNRRLMDDFFSSVLGLDAPRALALSKAIDARDKIGPEKYQAWLGELGIGADAAARLEEFFGLSLAEIARRYPGRGATELVELWRLLEESGAAAGVVFDPRVMRGLDYYTGTVFEMYDVSPENRRAMFGGGRYDNLVGLFGGAALSGVGLGLGDVTMAHFLEVHGLLPKLELGPDVYVTLPVSSLRPTSERIARELRAAGLSVVTALEVGGFGAQLKAAARQQARWVVLLGESELAQASVALKELSSGAQHTVALSELAGWLTARIAKPGGPAIRS